MGILSFYLLPFIILLCVLNFDRAFFSLISYFGVCFTVGIHSLHQRIHIVHHRIHIVHQRMHTVHNSVCGVHHELFSEHVVQHEEGACEQV